MELCNLNLECWIERKWNEATEKKLPYLTGNIHSRMRMGQIWDVMKDITRALAFIHSEKEVHRDLKLRNGKAKSFDLLGAMSLGQGNIQSSQPDITEQSLVSQGRPFLVNHDSGIVSAWKHDSPMRHVQVATFPMHRGAATEHLVAFSKGLIYLSEDRQFTFVDTIPEKE